ncbi:MAG: hypothetical protein HFF18_12310 [Oscillospiraceae bacterium]|nr:hypothetical protein [Oscillospiraceae bacterium]
MIPKFERHLILSDPQQSPPAAFCDCCGGEIYACDPLWRVAGEIICEECFPGFTLRYFASCRKNGAQLLAQLAWEEQEREP